MTPSELQGIWAALGIPADYASSRGLPFQPDADETTLVLLGLNADRREIRLTAPAAAAWEKMRRAAAAGSIALLPLSGFRSIARQSEIVRAKLARGQAIGDILRLVAAPGCSEHHTGRALDLGTPGTPPLEENFADTPAFAWLSAHAGRFGFTLSYPRESAHRIAFEPWHWLWRP